MNISNRIRIVASSLSTHMRLARLIVALSDAEKERMTKRFKREYAKYKKKHPKSKKTEGQYVKEMWDKHDSTVDRQRGEDARKELDKQKRRKDKLKEKSQKGDSGGDKVTDMSDKAELEELGIDVDISKVDLVEAIKDILDDDDDPKDIGESLEAAAEKLTEIVDFDDYVKGMPNEAKQLANHLKQKQEKAETEATKVIGTGASYKEYADTARKEGNPVISEKRWKALHRKAQEEAEKELREEIRKNGPPDGSYAEYVEDKRKEREVPVDKATWNVLTKGKK
jgi:hypothetical protein